MDLENINYIVNHLFLPPKLPQEDDRTNDNRNAILDHVVESAAAFCQEVDKNETDERVRQRWIILSKMLRSMQYLRETAFIPPDALQHVIEHMQISDIICLHISQQNAGVILRKLNGAHITLEFFQASPTAAAVAGNRGKLLIQFPSRPRLSIPISPQSIKSLCAYLATMDCTSMPNATPSSRKAGKTQAESREVSDIRFISEILGGIARVLTYDLDGVASSTVYVGKRINDHVLWDKALNPWRRDPQWLVIRVALQTSLEGWNMDERYGYKAFVTYVLVRALQKAIQADLDHDLLFVMNAKIATRVSKLSFSEYHGFQNHYIMTQSKNCRKLLEDGWQNFQKADTQRLSWTIPTRKGIQMAGGFSLIRSRDYLSTVYNRCSALERDSSGFSPETFEASLIKDNLREKWSPPDDIPPVSVGADHAGVDIWLAILDVERWIIHDLHDWKKETAPQLQLSTLGQMITRHDKLTSSLKNPELFSKVFLVVLELWVAFDMAACKVIPLLKDYSHELSVESFKPLILPTLSQMQRLEEVEAYLISRHSKACYKKHSVFEFTPHEDSFAARYFANNDSLQSLWSRIQIDATTLKEEKIREYKRLNDEYNQLQAESEVLDCEHVVIWKRNHPIRVHSSHCQKCAIRSKARNMSISIFEWPLPEDELRSHLVVFELQLPQSFGLWRDITYGLGRNHSSTASLTNPRPAVMLEGYTPLHDYFVANHPRQHISIASTSKSYHVSHYKECKLPCLGDDVIKKHPLCYKLYDNHRNTWVPPTEFPIIDISEQCTMQLPPGPYQKLFWTLVGTDHTPNAVIARQSECPIEISYHEWEAFGHLRSGNRLQWRNIVLELVRNTLTFRDPAVHILFRQAAWQAEERSDVVYREAHIDLARGSFGKEVVEALNERLDCIRDNWQEGWTAATLSMIACRLFSLNHSSVVRRDLLKFLENLRETLLQWMYLILHQKRSQVDLTAVSAAEITHRVILVAGTCRSTYAFDNDEVFISVFADHHNAATFIKCAMVLQSNVPEKLSTLSDPLRYIVERDIVLSAETVERIIPLIIHHNDGLEDAVRYVWQGFQRNPVLPWRRISGRSSWIACETVMQNGDDQACYVHLDLLDGTFLVNGKTLSTLPNDILRHNLFRRVFPNQFTMDIVPSKMRGMVYQLSQSVDCQDRKLEIHFAKNGNELLIRTRDLHSQDVSEFLTTHRLKEDLPNALLVGMVHIYHYSSNCLQGYPAPSGWDPSALPAWTMRFTEDPMETSGSRPILTEGTLDCIGRAVLCPDSPVVRGLFAIFRPLETSIGNLLVTWTPSTDSRSVSSRRIDGDLQVHLPRYKLTFVVDDQDNLKCKELPGLVVSPTQSIGTFFGLKNKLILDPKDGKTMRKVIVPDGDIVVSPNPITKSHPEVMVVPCQHPGVQIRIFIYDVDELIGRLIGDDTLTSWYFQTYLHILTSSYLPDPLTHRTGVEQALTMLESSNSFAFMELTPEQMKYLRLIVDVTPVRRYYPAHLTSMENVQWHSVLSPLSQSDRFVPLVQAILDHGRNQALFYGNAAKAAFKSYEGSSSLRERAELRNSRSAFNNFYENERLCDSIYSPACCLETTDGNSIERENRVVQTAALVNQWTTNLDALPNLWKEFQNWRVFSTRIDDGITFDCPNAWLLKPLSQTWFSLYSCCLNASRDKDMYGLMFALGILSHRSDINPQLIHGALAVATKVASTPCLRPDKELFLTDQFLDLAPGHDLQFQEIQDISKRCCIPFKASPQARMEFDSEVGPREVDFFRRQDYKEAREEQCYSLSRYLFSQWPTSAAQIPDTGTESGDYSLINKSNFRTGIEGLFFSRFLNRCLFYHTDRLQHALGAIQNHKEDQIMLPIRPNPPAIDPLDLLPSYVHVTLSDLVLSNNRSAVLGSLDNARGWISSESETKTTHCFTPSSTRSLISRLPTAKDTGFLSRYASDLRQCVRALETRTSRNSSHHHDSHPPRTTIENIQHALQPQNNREHMLYIAGLWPSLGPESLLGQLSLRFRKGLHPDWQSALVRYAEGIALHQRERRIGGLQRLGLEAECIKEAANHGGEGWEAAEHLDWLLIQIDANLLIRPVQASIAREMMSPQSRQNTVMQLNMGEGKSSVIVPIISASLADGEQLVRVIVLKPLCAQMFHLLKQRLCGLANRRLFYLPFSRSVSLDADKVRVICGMFEACARAGGVLLCQPEHILSFQLMGLHLLCNTEDTKQAAPFLRAQEWLDLKARDILDESDEILSVRYQLIYSLGTPGPLEGQPDRWQTIQNVFSLLKDILNKVASDHRGGLEVESIEPLSQRFPRTRILTHQCGGALLELIARQIVFKGTLPSSPFRSYPSELRERVFHFLTKIDITQKDSDTLEDYSADYFGQLLLLRGLIAHGILLLSLKEKRWRVDYGLDPSRSMLAVPYRAKDCPSTRAEFGHPDMIIVLTCLSYYYGGLSDKQLERTFQHLLETDTPELRYEDWIKGYATSLPESLRHLRGLNLDDNHQKYHHIFPRLRGNKAVIDFYLSACVFPREAKAFQHKLTTNAWDLARTKTKLTTGFSGTNDNSYLLPLSIRQLDSDDQRHTNAQVLEYILREENRSVVHTKSTITGLGLIEQVVVQDPHISVLLDVGAQVLELQNEDVAREWLKRDKDPGVEAAIYCDSSNDEFYVLTRDGHIEPLESSLYRTQLDKALVYLDEARTRGTDFKFPIGTRAVVTLGPKLNKDKLVQGCMRMRKLGSDHSVLFFASSEIWRKIQECIGVQKDMLDSSDVLIWTMLETCAAIRDNGAHWASQGLNFDDRRTAWETYKSTSSTLSRLTKVLRETESRTLKELYGVKETDTVLDGSSGKVHQTERRQEILTKCQEFGIMLSSGSALLEEQERELAHEKEDEREVEGVLATRPLEHSIDLGLPSFIQSGTRAFLFRSLADCLEDTSHYSNLLTISRTFFQSTFLRATSDFASTIWLSLGQGPSFVNDYLRSVQWILRPNSQPDVLVLISPFEANALLPDIRKSKSVRLHVYSPRVSRQSRSFENLDFLVVPQPRGAIPPVQQSIQQLNLFSGQLFFRDWNSFQNICQMLGLYLGEIPEELTGKVDGGGFVRDVGARWLLGIQECAFSDSPVGFLRELIGWRRKGQSFTLTHLGQILRGNDLEASEFRRHELPDFDL